MGQVSNYHILQRLDQRGLDHPKKVTMIDTTANSVSAADNDDKVVGFFSAIFHWRNMLEDILRAKLGGIVAVIENCI